MHFLHTYLYLTYIKCTKVIGRNLVLIKEMKPRVLAAVEMTVEKGKKPVKPQVRFFENIKQNLSDIQSLAGLNKDLDFHHEVEAKMSYYTAARCFYYMPWPSSKLRSGQRP